MKKLALFLATQKGFSVLEQLCKSEHKENIGCVVSFHEVGVQKDWCDEIMDLCETYCIPFCIWGDIKDDLHGLARNYSITSVIAISWRFLLPLSMNDLLEDRIIVFHDSLLPKYRGFAPIVTAMLCRENVIGATALFADEAVDAGDIILQKSIRIANNEYIAQVIDKMSDLYVSMVMELMKKLKASSIKATPQVESDVTYSIWRGDCDYEIDWSMDAVDIYNQIRATGYPYKCALTHIDGVPVRIVSAELNDDINFAVRDCGKIWNLGNGSPLIVCGKGMLRITKAVCEDKNPYTFTKLRTKLGWK